MTKIEAFNSVIPTCIGCGDSGVFYLEPLWRIDPALHEFADDPAAMAEIKEMLELTVAKRNAEADLVHPVVNWLYKLMTEEGAAALNEGEIKLMEDMMEYMRARPEDQKRKAGLDGWSFARK